MPYEIVLTRDAEHDLEDHVLERLLRTTDALRSSPERGSYVSELRSLGISDYRQVLFKPYRLIYRVHATQVVVYVVADGRRDLASLLARRLLGA
jgi:toxin ParE1/3/4